MAFGHLRQSKKISGLRQKKKPSSQRWLMRNMRDPYVRQAEQDGVRCRSYFKLQQLDEKFHLFPPGTTVLDLGCSPGGWSAYACARLASPGKVMVTGIDLRPTDPMDGAVFLQGDACCPVMQEAMGRNFHLILSDMAPSFCGHGPTDYVKMEALMEDILHITHSTLRPGGTLVMKAFHSPFVKQVRTFFHKVHHVKPKASRANSREIYLVAKDYKGPGEHAMCEEHEEDLWEDETLLV